MLHSFTNLKFMATASGLFNTIAAMMEPCSVKAKGSLRRPPWDAVANCDQFGVTASAFATVKLEVANCDFKFSNSGADNWNMKSSGKRSALRLTCSLSRFVGTP